MAKAQGDLGLRHGAAKLPAVEIRSYNLDIRERGSILNDRVRKQAFFDMLDEARRILRKTGEDPFGDRPSQKLGKKKIADWLLKGKGEAAALILGAIEEFAGELADIARHFLNKDEWKGVARIVIGGGFRDGPIGELAIARAGLLLKADGINVPLQPIRHHPDEGGLIGAVQLMPVWMLKGHNALLAADIGGTNIRAGIVALNLDKAPDLSKAAVWKSELWRHADEKPSRTAAVDYLSKVLDGLRRKAEQEKQVLAPVIGVGCPGVIEPDGAISRGGMNLPGGNWESDHFNLPRTLAADIGRIENDEVMVVMHNDAVVQGLSEVPFMRDVKRWGALTIGTGLGNACYENLPD